MKSSYFVFLFVLHFLIFLFYSDCNIKNDDHYNYDEFIATTAATIGGAVVSKNVGVALSFLSIGSLARCRKQKLCEKHISYLFA